MEWSGSETGYRLDLVLLARKYDVMAIIVIYEVRWL